MAKPLPWLKPGIFVGGVAPGAAIAAHAARGTLAADPIAEALNRFGLLALIFLIATLACSPLKALFGWIWPLRVRRMLGLFAFGYALLHVGTYAILDKVVNLSAILEDLAKRPFILVGALAFSLLVPLAVTSTSAAVRRLGYARWKRLHLLVYPAAILACVHFILRVKKDLAEPAVYAGLLAVLLGLRVLFAVRAARLQPKGSVGGSARR